MSTTWSPCVLITFTVWPALTYAAAPLRAGMSVGVGILITEGVEAS